MIWFSLVLIASIGIHPIPLPIRLNQSSKTLPSGRPQVSMGNIGRLWPKLERQDGYVHP
jgi:hypothetical protein